MNYDLVQEQRVGMRDTNQDYAIHDATEQAMLLAVADGMGGYLGGEMAAEIAVGSIWHSFSEAAIPTIANPAEFLERALVQAHTDIHAYAREQELVEVPRTVIVACVVQQDRAWWNHVGDSRLYLIRDKHIEAQTRDHTSVQARVDAGEISPEQAYNHPESSRMLQSLGAPQLPEPGPGANARLQQDDILLLCSDGFWGPLKSSQLVNGLNADSLTKSIFELSDIAERRAGAHADNLTVLAVKWQGDDCRIN